jgi:methylmalonyl-CoA carboxyltransferase 5S subunit
VFNVMMGRYKVLTGEFADLMLGYYGETIGQNNPQVVALAAKQTGKTPIDGRPADLLKPEWPELRNAAVALPGSNGSDEDVLTYAMFPKVAPKFFTTRADGPKNLGVASAPAAAPAPEPAKAAPSATSVRVAVTYDVKLNGKSHKVTVAPSK